MAVLVETDAPVRTPGPLVAGTVGEVVMILAMQLPVSADRYPHGTGPLPKDAQPVRVYADAEGLAQQPARPRVVVIAAMQMPVRLNPLKRLRVAPQNAPAVSEQANAFPLFGSGHCSGHADDGCSG